MVTSNSPRKSLARKKILGEKEESFDAARGFAEGKNVTVSHAMPRRAIGFLRVRCGIRSAGHGLHRGMKSRRCDERGKSLAPSRLFILSSQALGPELPR
jgi:hypothetical protein